MQHHWQKVASGTVVVSKNAQGLFDQACQYFKWCDENPVENYVTIKSGKAAGASIIEKFPRPYSIEGLCVHCGITKDYIASLRSLPATDIYKVVIEKILHIIYLQIYEFGMTGVYNPIFSAKALNIENNEDAGAPVTVTIITDKIPQLADSESDILNKMQLEFSKNDIPKEQSENLD